MRETHEWTDAELAYLESFYVLRGGAFIRAKYPALTPNAIRQMATRLNLADDLREYTPLQDVAEEAGVTEFAVYHWLHARPWARKHCRRWGRVFLMPTPVVSLYLTACRAPARPRGWWGTARAADFLGVDLRTVQKWARAGVLDAVQCGRTLFIDPHSAHQVQAELRSVPGLAVQVNSLANVLGLSNEGLRQILIRDGWPTVKCSQQGLRVALYLFEKDARAFLSARGHRGEQVETVLRRAVALDVARVKI